MAGRPTRPGNGREPRIYPLLFADDTDDNLSVTDHALCYTETQGQTEDGNSHMEHREPGVAGPQ